MGKEVGWLVSCVDLIGWGDEWGDWGEGVLSVRFSWVGLGSVQFSPCIVYTINSLNWFARSYRNA